MRYYYTDPLVAAFMAREFGVKIDAPVLGANGEPKRSSLPIPTWVWGRIIEAHERNLKKGFSPHKYYIHPDSLPIFELRVGDVCLNPDGMPTLLIRDGNYKPGISNLHNEIPLSQAIEAVNEDAAIIISREEKPFFWPEVEG